MDAHDKILIVDFGSQVTQLIARRVREEKVYCEIVPFQKAEAALRDMKPKGIILSGGPASVLDKDAPLAPMAVYQAGVPVLGICYGEQAMAHQLGGRVEAGHHREFGRAEVEVTLPSALTDGVWQVGERYPVWMSHGDRVTKLPEGFAAIATSSNAPIAMIGDEKRKFYATQFHLEVVHTPHGAALLRNFVRRIAGCTGDWTMRAFKDEAIAKIRRQVGGGRVICGLSGGVDFRRCGRADPRGDRRSAHLRVRRSRPAAARRRRESRGTVSRQLQHSARACECRRCFYRRAGGRR